ncbi:MAG: hypothetical protein J5781_07755, partial [Clostridia bacterium]|nr:hypothetical protein [Clostridia bacterium]
MKTKTTIIVLAVALLITTMFMCVACQPVTTISELSNYKKEKTTELQEYADELLREYTYSEHFLQCIREIIDDGKETIKRADSEYGVNIAFKNAKRELDQLPPILEYNAKEIFDYANYIGNGKGKIKNSYLAQNRTYGIEYLNEEYDPDDPNSKQILEDTTSPRYRANIITERSQL